MKENISSGEVLCLFVNRGSAILEIFPRFRKPGTALIEFSSKLTIKTLFKYREYVKCNNRESETNLFVFFFSGVLLSWTIVNLKNLVH